MNTSPSGSPHWIVPTYHRMRTVAFGYASLFGALYLYETQAPLWLWIGLAAQFWVYPHLVYWRALKAADPQKAELNNLLLDMTLWGVWSVALGFPRWITFTLFISSAINNAISLGHERLVHALAAFALGVSMGILLFGFQLGPDESAWVSWLCAMGLTGYLMGIGQIAYRRTLSLRKIRERLKHSELSLQQANEDLRSQLHKIETLQQQLQSLVDKDTLTGLFNRRYLETMLDADIARCGRAQMPLSLMMIDIDHFKSINDQHGHAIGDEVLRQLGGLLRRHLRMGDTPCRIGGEEFVLVLPGMTAEQALERGERIRVAFEAVAVSLPNGNLHTTLSAGIATLAVHGATSHELLRQADKALYAAKAQGRNGVRMAEVRSAA